MKKYHLILLCLILVIPSVFFINSCTKHESKIDEKILLGEDEVNPEDEKQKSQGSSRASELGQVIAVLTTTSGIQFLHPENIIMDDMEDLFDPGTSITEIDIMQLQGDPDWKLMGIGSNSGDSRIVAVNLILRNKQVGECQPGIMGLFIISAGYNTCSGNPCSSCRILYEGGSYTCGPCPGGTCDYNSSSLMFVTNNAFGCQSTSGCPSNSCCTEDEQGDCWCDNCCICWD